MAIIDIHGLRIEDVIFALFKNVYRKSKESQASYSFLLSMTVDEIGIYRMPYPEEIREAIKDKRFIDHIGCVKFGLNITGTILDTEFYDKHHQTGANDINTAEEVIEELIKTKRTSTYSFADLHRTSCSDPSHSLPKRC